MQYRLAPVTFFIWGGLLIWAVDFLVVYVFAAIACARGFSHVKLYGLGIVPLVTTLVSFVAFLATAAILRVALRGLGTAATDTLHPEPFMNFVAFGLSALALVATVWLVLPPLLLGNAC